MKNNSDFYAASNPSVRHCNLRVSFHTLCTIFRFFINKNKRLYVFLLVCRYASLYFCCALENQDNELLALEILHRYVELLDKYFGNVCELDIIFNFEKAYFILDEFLMGGEIQETS
uniref:AP complex mu/sigma subunit domain-containing protein n=1 Tax=Sinocyclocheilus rhinocerous TaxID=307959 RepID=A0A673FVU4_9TELE